MNVSISTLFSFNFVPGKPLENFCNRKYELIYCKNGSGEVTINNQTMPFNTNDVLFLRPNQARTQIAFEKSSYICVRFDIHNDKFNIPSNCYCCKTDVIYNLFKNILNEYEHKHIAYYHICNSKTFEILCLLFRIQSTDINVDTILKIINEIDETYNYSKSVEEMANSANYSYDYFRHKFKSITGKSPVQYIIDSKMEHACKLLFEHNLNCTEISYMLGFASSSQFSKIFKKKIGVSPSEYQKISIKSSENNENNKNNKNNQI